MQLVGQEAKGLGDALKQKPQRPGDGIGDGKFQMQGEIEGYRSWDTGRGHREMGRRRHERREAWVQRQENEGRQEGGRLGTGEGGTMWPKVTDPRWALQAVSFLPPRSQKFQTDFAFVHQGTKLRILYLNREMKRSCFFCCCCCLPHGKP